MRTQAELLSDLSRLEGARFDDTVFELFHRGPKSIDRLRSFVSTAEPGMKTKVEASVARQWTRLQELLANLDPAALSSPGVKYALTLGPADAIARRALRSIDMGEYETAACLAAALGEESTGRYDGAELESLLAMAAGRPERALELLRPYLAPGAYTGRAAPVFARAAMAAGLFDKAYSEFPEAALWGMMGAADCAMLGQTVHRAAMSGRPESWERIAESICAAATALAVEGEQTLRALADSDGTLANALEAVDYTVDGLQQASSEGMARSIGLELAEALEQLAGEAGDAADTLSRLAGAGSNQLAGQVGAVLEVEGFDTAPADAEPADAAPGSCARWQRTVQGFDAGRRPEVGDYPRQVKALASLAGFGVRAFWADGRRVIELKPMPTSAPEGAAGRSVDLDSPECTSAVLTVLRGQTPPKAAEILVAQAIAHVQSKVRHAARDGAQAMAEIATASGAGRTEARNAARTWLGLAPAQEHTAGRGQQEAVHPDDPPGPGGDESGEGLEDARPSETEQALRTATLLVRAAAAGQLPQEQHELIPFLMARAIMGALEQERGDELAAYRLRPALTAMVEQSGRRRRDFKQAHLARLCGALGGQWNKAQVQAALEKLCAIVLDGANRKLASDPAIAGVALACSGLASGDEAQVRAGQALTRFASAMQAAGARAGAPAMWQELEVAASDAFDAVRRGDLT